MPESQLPTPSVLHDLVTLQPSSPVLSVHLRTDPRDPANTNHHPAWHIDLRNGLRAIESELEAEDRKGSLAVREMAGQLDSEISGLDAAVRGRSISLFMTADRTVDIRLTSQLPLQESTVKWDRRPFVTPLVDVVDRGRATGIVLLDGDEVHLLHWEAGQITLPDNNTYELELKDWRRSRGGPAGGGQSQTTVSHHEQHAAREEDHRRRFLTDAAQAVGKRVPELGWQRMLLVAAPGTLQNFQDALPEQAQRLIVSTVESHITGIEPSAVADHLEDELAEAWQRETGEVVESAIDHSRAGGAGATGVAEVLDALSQARVAHLVYDPALQITPDQVGPQVRSVLGDVPMDMVLERAVEHAVETDAQVSALPGDSPLDDVGGIVALLRW
jgi:protein required for attachment to host cells